MFWKFTAHIKDLEEFNDDHAEALYGRCTDATLSSSSGHSKIAFDRKAASLSDAIRSAIADIAAAGLVVSAVELDEHELAELP